MSSVLSRRTVVLRAASGLAIATFLLIGPVVGQVFGVATAKVYPRWEMFVGKARSVCQLAYHTVDEAGREHLVDHLALTSLDKRRAPVRIKRSQIAGLNSLLCRRLRRDPPADLRLLARCGSRRRWVDHSQLDRSVCLPPL